MNFLLFVVVIGIVAYFWNKKKSDQKEKVSQTLNDLDNIGQVIGRPIIDLTNVLGDPWLRESKDNNTVRFMWNLGKINIIAEWDKTDSNNRIVYFLRSDRL